MFRAKSRSGLGWKRTTALLAVLGLVLGACSESNPEAERAAYEATKPWIAWMDEGEYEKCWDEAAPWFRDNISSRDMWIAKARETRDPLGKLLFRELNTTTYKTNPMGAPDGEYTIVVYTSSWDAGNIYESVSMQRQADGSWGVVGYFVKQQ
ncbi:MAG: DUF4019 domain-containing protein [Gammaproteobacteria bacterium]|nr:DUF4019 domain-containing protein [Gammaproteobacteria bacterium]